MEIIVRIIQDINRHLNLGLYLLVDSNNILVNSLVLGRKVMEFSSEQSLELYLQLTELLRISKSWSMHSLAGKTNVADTIRGQIYSKFNFDINRHYKISKYGSI